MSFNFWKRGGNGVFDGVRFKITFVHYIYVRKSYSEDEIVKLGTATSDSQFAAAYQWLTEFIAGNGGVVLDPEIFQDINGIDIRCDVRINLGVLMYLTNSHYSRKVAVNGIVETSRGFNLAGFRWGSMKKAERAIRRGIKRLPQMKRVQSEIVFSLPGLTDEQRFDLVVDD